MLHYTYCAIHILYYARLSVAMVTIDFGKNLALQSILTVFYEVEMIFGVSENSET